MRSGGIETVAIANGNHRFSKLAYDFEIPLKDLVQKTQGLAFWQCRSCWLVVLGCPHVRPLRCDFRTANDIYTLMEATGSGAIGFQG